MLLKKIINNLDKNFKHHSFSGIKFNSRECKHGDIFFAIKGTKINGNKFIGNAIKNGAKTIISDQKFAGLKDDVLFLNHKNPRMALASAASILYKKKPKNLIAVTGTNGKSSIANFFFQILKLNNKKVASIGTLGINTNNYKFHSSNTTLDSLSLNKVLNDLKEKNFNTVILEASSHGLKQHRLDGLNFDIGIFTNLSRDHLDYHKSFKDYFNSKMILFKRLMKKNSTTIFSPEENYGSKIQKIINKLNLKYISIGKRKSDITLIKENLIKDKQKISFSYKGNIYSFETSLIGKIQIINLLMAITAASKYIPIKRILKLVPRIRPVSGRLEKIGQLKNKSKVILDYAHTPDALKTCLKNIRYHYRFSKISIVFGCGGERDTPKRQIMGRIANHFCNKIYLTDDNPRNENPSKIRNQIKKKINKSKLLEISSRSKAIEQAVSNLDSGDVLVVAGKGHENYQEYVKKKFFSDKKCILKNINIRNKNLSNDWKINLINQNFKYFLPDRTKKINNISINSREIKKNDLFIGIKGKKIDGNLFADDAIKKGALCSIIDKNYSKKNKRKKIKVKNSLKFLSELSNQIRKISNTTAIAITGSAGKTSLKELLGQTLSRISSTSYSKNSFNNKYGVPLSLSNIHKNNSYGVFEVGMNKKGEIDFLSKNIMPDVGVITNISFAHVKNFKNISQIAKAKSELIDNINKDGLVVLNKDDKYFNFFKIKAKKRKLKIISFSKKKKANVQLIKSFKNKSNYYVLIKVQNKIKKFLVDKKTILFMDNLLASLAVISNFIDLNDLNEKLFFFNFNIPKGRGNKIQLKLKNKIINIVDESYNSNPLSMKFALNKFEKIKVNSKKKNILLGDMLELGYFSKKLHIQAAKTINKSKINKVYAYGKDIKFTFDMIKTQKKGMIFKKKNEIIKFIKNDLINNDYLMIKGSNAIGLGDVISKFNKGKI